MKIFLALLGAVIGALVGVFYLGSLAADIYTRSVDFQSPTQAGDAHAMTFLITTFLAMMLGYFIGWFSGLIIQRRDQI